MRPALLFVSIALAIQWWPAAVSAQEDPADPARAAKDSIIAAIQKERRTTEEWLRSSPNSYLATIQRVDFGERTTLTVGRATDNDVCIEDPTITSHHLQVTVSGDMFRVETVDLNASFAQRGQVVQHAVLGPSTITVGRFLLRLSHQRFPALIVFDPLSPRFNEYKGLKYFPIDLAYRYVLPLTRNPDPDTVTIWSTRGNRRHALRVGWFEFEVGKTTCRLEVTRLLEPGIGERSYSIFFRDATCGDESYPMGRYVEAEPLSNGTFVLDFNNSYNPACAFSIHYNCPIPPKANELSVRIPAGEMDPHYLQH